MKIPHNVDLVLVTSSCSYSGPCYEVARLLGTNLNIHHIHVGEAGRSNFWISQSIIYCIEEVRKVYSGKIVSLVSWSSIDRNDLFVDKRTNSQHHKINFAEYTKKAFWADENSFRVFKWFDDVLTPTEFDDSREFGLLSLTNLVSDQPDSPIFLEEFTGKHYKYFHNESERFHTSLMNFVALQSYCTINEVQLINLTWQDIWHQVEPKYFIRGQRYYSPHDPRNAVITDYSDYPLRIDVYPEFKYLYNQINFDQWIFCNVANTTVGGTADWCISNDLVKYFGGENNPGHPSQLGYAQYSQFIYPEILNKINNLPTP